MYKALLKDHFRFVGIILRLLDLSVLLISCLLSFLIYFEHFNPPSNYIHLLLIVLFFSVPLFPYFPLYRTWRGESLFNEVKAYFFALSMLFLSTALLLFLLKEGSEYSRLWFVFWYSLALFIGIFARIALRITLRKLRTKGYNQKNIVIIGDDNLGKKVTDTLSQADWAGFHIKAILTDGKKLSEYLKNETIDDVWIALPLKEEDKVKQILKELMDTTVNIRLVPDIFGFSLLNHSITEIAGLPVIELTSSPMNTGNSFIKSIEDKVLASLILILISPIMLVVAIGVKMSSSGPIFFRQRRYGLSGESIWVWKFRSMTVCEDDAAFKQATANDKRVTKFGAFIRRTSLDELPQFINVLQGQMSIVGPRPHPVKLNEDFRQLIPKYMLRHIVKPGITGWAQINGYRGETETLEKMEQRITYDLYYIDNWSLWLDLKIIFLTVFKGFIDKNAY
ncbi:undecaprenyl-phosphate glucose phosphotransferase [Candidatus Marithrix sp. Canyon 246]|uniref:undecaprenyl-phosphate glucose phosphotransferase n=1 Tax=Candidatus Marithrix sp. Canyon 246 TaxID=1827136 RepID=UPI00084A0CDB|nr:undecaprenyl-phosphate glucose phosphotransferase [Candidatus Marithrix sp. Canyon 246]